MKRQLRGKCLVRKSTLTNGEEVLTICGNFYPNFNINEIKDNDEMWVCDMTIEDGGLRFTNPTSIDGGSPENFLNGDNNLPKHWNTKEKL